MGLKVKTNGQGEKNKMCDQCEKLGTQMPVEVLELLCDQGGQTLFDYLKDNQAPTQVLTLLSNLLFVTQYIEKRVNRSPDKGDAETVYKMLPEMSNNILDLGGEIENTFGSTFNGRIPIKWGSNC